MKCKLMLLALTALLSMTVCAKAEETTTDETAFENAWNLLVDSSFEDEYSYAVSEACDSLSDEISLEMDSIQNMQEEEVIVSYHFEEIISSSPDFFKGLNIAYAIPCTNSVSDISCADYTFPRVLVIYKKHSVNHSALLSLNANLEQNVISFKKHIDELYDESNIFDSHSTQQSNLLHTTFTLFEDYHDTYTYGANTENAVCSYYTTFDVERTISVSNDDVVTITATTKVCPYFGEFFTTNWYRFGIYRNDNSSYIYRAYPRTDGTIDLNEQIDISVSLGIPASAGISFDISFTAGNTLKAWIKDNGTNYGANFQNLQGVRGNNPDGSFEFTSGVTIEVKKSVTDFSFCYAQLFQNAIYTTGLNPSLMGNKWKVITSDQIGFNQIPSSSIYIHDGIDYSLVFDPEYYLNNNSDVYAAFGYDYIAAFSHFLNNGMSEARIAKDTFNVVIYRSRYEDLNAAFGDDWSLYYKHYIQHGYSEGRCAV